MRNCIKVFTHRIYKWRCERCSGMISSPIDPCRVAGARKGRMYVCPHCNHEFAISSTGKLPDEPPFLGKGSSKTIEQAGRSDAQVMGISVKKIMSDYRE